MTKDDALTLALDVLERASHSLGSFVSDHGWGQEDMNTLDSVMAAEHRIREALAQPELCKYGNEVQTCSSSPMDCQCCHDALTDMADEEEDLYRLAEKADNGGQP